MRRLAAVGLVALASLSALILVGATSRPCCRAHHVPRLARVALVPLRLVFGPVYSSGTRSARAEEVLEFKRLPPESVSALERQPRRATPTPPTPPATPEPSDVPSSPAPPGEQPGRTGSITRIGSDVHIEKDQVVSGDLVVIGGDVTIDGHVEGGVVAMGGDVLLTETARVDGDVACIGGELTKEPGAIVGGQRVTATRLRQLRHYGHIRNVDGAVGRATEHGVHAATRFAASLIWLFILSVLAWGFASLAPGRTLAALATLKREPALSIGIGTLVWALFVPSVVALALVVAILCITIIGIPLALAALFGYFVFLGLVAAWGYVVFVAAIGEMTSKRTRLGAPAMTAAGFPPAEMSLARKAVLGVLMVCGAALVGAFLQALFFAPPLQALGTFISVVSRIAVIVGATFGAGALLRTEAVAGTFRRWWTPRAAAMPSAPAPAPPPAPPTGEPLPPPQQT